MSLAQKTDLSQQTSVSDHENFNLQNLDPDLLRDSIIENVEVAAQKQAGDDPGRTAKAETLNEIQATGHDSSDQCSRHSSGGGGPEGNITASSGVLLEAGKSGLSPLTLIGAETEKKCMRRAHSSASFEKYKHEKMKAAEKQSNPQTPNMSGWSTPQKPPSGSQTPSRSRHHSGIDISTPMSTIETSSRCSIGYDGMYYSGLQ